MITIIATQDQKYGIEILPHPDKLGETTARLVNIETGKPIPEDEPVFMLRGQDVFSEQTISYYLTMTAPSEHKAALVHRINDFIEFRINNPDRMKAPDTTYPYPKIK